MTQHAERIVKVGIIGSGGIANGKHIPNLIAQSNVEIVALCDIIEDRAIETAKKFNLESAHIYTDYKELLKDTSIEVIHVCTPNKSHSFITIDALESGKHVLCEKPMAKTAAEARLMLEAAKRTGKKLSIGYDNRYRPDSLLLKKVCERGELGEIYFAKAHAIRRRAVPTWGVFLNEDEQGGGPLIDIGTHALDLTLWLMDNYKVKSVKGNVYHKLGSKKDSANAFGPWDPSLFTVEDSAFGFITMDNGATVTLEASWALNTLDVGEAQATLCGTEGGADMKDGLRINGEELGHLFTKKPELNGGGVAYFDGKSESQAGRECRLWIESIINDTEPMVKAEQALVVTEILEAIYESARTGTTVYFD
ncbi:Gfo/Idh/MocA family protein [Paenibacillus macquariensis]|uniref:Predicted dehydrogenase n=1 Tax=Paenibacillus macquariensis TaxID=948756 RepID=A0ABY1K9T1_9BACL|nr:Gfo/Idh/MocA family oxidoreductase [Paenibacillus macquariensis]MEC0092398.1 Gfo/Idh/MocA family oxidoreductase [Paenibacillus macquariensis]OAB35368.1 oxidoreductase [Paenibacillus macquariensis subsp. macquariensis]SIR47891.1 Predicted dehydrogenase [Paenibacillus macquariensis]